MDISTFYAVTSATCFTLVGLWWTVVKDKPEWFKDEASKRLTGGVYASFLIPALMSLGAQLSGGASFIWQGVFIVAALVGGISSFRLVKVAREKSPDGAFGRISWMVPILYGIVLFFAIFPASTRTLGLLPLQLEGILLCGLILIAHVMAWEFMVNNPSPK